MLGSSAADRTIRCHHVHAVAQAVSNASKPTSSSNGPLDVLGRETLRLPGSVPNPALPTGTDTMPGIEHIVVVMLENHSFDNILGMLGRGDGWPLGRNGLPTSTNPYADGRLQHAFHMPTTCQLPSQPSQEWRTSNLAFNNGLMDGFVRSPISPQLAGDVGGVAMGYWDRAGPAVHLRPGLGLPHRQPLVQSLLGQTDPNRRFLVAGTSSGMTDDISTHPRPVGQSDSGCTPGHTDPHHLRRALGLRHQLDRLLSSPSRSVPRPSSIRSSTPCRPWPT